MLLRMCLCSSFLSWLYSGMGESGSSLFMVGFVCWSGLDICYNKLCCDGKCYE